MSSCVGHEQNGEDAAVAGRVLLGLIVSLQAVLVPGRAQSCLERRYEWADLLPGLGAWRGAELAAVEPVA